MQDLSDLRIVEIGRVPYLKALFPDKVTYFSTSSDGDDPVHANDGTPIVPLGSLGALWRALRDPQTSLVVCRPTFLSPWHWNYISRTLFDRRTLHRLALWPRAMGPQLVRWRVPPPVVIWDDADLPLINRNNFFLLDRCALYFKRELPPDRWRLFMKTGHAHLPTARFRRSARYLARIDKLRPISMGAPQRIDVPPVEKSTDIFFAGMVEGSSSVRKRGLPELLALRQRGFAVDIPEQRLPRSEFYRRCAQAYMTWSPEGHGWDCFRHYEAALCGSVPLINQPTIERYQPLLAGEHAIYYDVEVGALRQAAVAALANRPRLAAMGQAARAHAIAHHIPAAIARYVVRTSLGMANGASDLLAAAAPQEAAAGAPASAYIPAVGGTDAGLR